METSKKNCATKNFPLRIVLQQLGLWTTQESMDADRAKALYFLAHDLYQSGQYSDAKKIFLYLILGAEFDPQNLFALAACFHAEKDHATALRFYRLCAQSGMNHPLLYFHLSSCLLHFGKKRQAILELNKILEKSDGTRELQRLQTKAKAMIDLLEFNPEK